MYFLLAPLSLLWGVVVYVRGKLFDFGFLPTRGFDLPIISVGNLAVGGTGKTPHVEYILRLLHAEGYQPAMLSRGYGRRTKGYLLADERTSGEEIGDEPFQVSRNCPFAPVAVCEKRVKGVERLLRDRPDIDVIVLDDAYQHRYIRPGFSVLLTAASRLFTSDRLLPLGRLREPPSAASRADVIIITKCGEDERPVLCNAPPRPLYYSKIVYGLPYKWSGDAVSDELFYEGRRVLLLVGVADPSPLIRHITEYGAAVVKTLRFPDHHAFTPAELSRVRDEWDGMGEQSVVVTTEKDAARLKGFTEMLPKEKLARLYVQPITVSVEAANHRQQTFNQLILDYVYQNSRNSRMD